MSAVATETDALWFIDSRARVRVSYREGGVSVVEVEAPSGSMPPLHVHDEDESFYVLEGEATFWVGDEIVSVEAGSAFTAPKDVPHTFRVESAGGVRWLVITSLGHFEDFVRAVSRPAEGPGVPVLDGPPTEEQAAAIAEIGAANGVVILGPPGMLPTEL